MTTPQPDKTVWPTLIYADATAAISFLVDTFGFVAALVVPGATTGMIDHAQLMWPEGGGVMLSSAGRPGNPFSMRPTGSASVYVVTDEPDRLYAQAVAARLPIVADLADEDHGSRGFSVSDPEGNIGSFGTYRGH